MTVHDTVRFSGPPTIFGICSTYHYEEVKWMKENTEFVT
jgi:hypothetical protein